MVRHRFPRVGVIAPALAALALVTVLGGCGLNAGDTFYDVPNPFAEQQSTRAPAAWTQRVAQDFAVPADETLPVLVGNTYQGLTRGAIAAAIARDMDQAAPRGVHIVAGQDDQTPPDRIDCLVVPPMAAQPQTARLPVTVRAIYFKAGEPASSATGQAWLSSDPNDPRLAEMAHRLVRALLPQQVPDTALRGSVAEADLPLLGHE